MSSTQPTYKQLSDEVERLQARVNQLESLVNSVDRDRSTHTATRSSSDQFDALLEDAFEGIAILDADGRIQRIGPSILEILGYLPDEVVGRIVFEFIHPDDLPLATAALKRLLEEGKAPVSEVHRFYHKDGSVRYIEARTVNQLDNPRIRGLVAHFRDATESHKAHEALVKSEARFRALVENSFDVINLFSAEGQSLYTSPSVTNVLGYAPEELIGRPGLEILHPDDVEEAARGFAACLERPGAVERFTHRLRHKDGSYRNVEITGTNLLEEPGIHAMVSILRDVTDAKRAEAELKESEQRLKALIHTAPEAITVLDLEENRFVEVNDNAVKLCGYPREALLQMNPGHLSPPTQPDGRTFQEVLQELVPRLMAGEQVTIEWLFRRADGTEFPGEVRIVDFPAGTRRQIRSSVFDITERKRAEQALKQTRFAVDSAAEAMFTINREGRFVDVNRTACRRLEYTRDELLAMSVADINPHYPLEAWPEHWKELKQAGRSEYESEHQTKSGRVFPVEISKSFFEFEGSQYAFAFVRDITERKLAQEERRKLVSLVENSYDFIGLSDMSGHVTYVNRAGMDLVGLASLDDARKLTHADFLRRDDVTCLTNTLIPALKKRGYWVGELHFRHFGSGESVPMDVNSFVIADEDSGQPISVGIVARDISERRSQEVKLRDQQEALAHVARLSTMGEMVAGIAHEINQPLFAICNFAQASASALEARDDKKAAQLADWISQINDQAVSCGDIIRRLRDFVTKNAADRQVVNANDVIRESVALAALDLRENPIPVVLDLVSPDPHVNAIRVQLQQVIVNLLRNACEAISVNEAVTGQIIVRSFVSDDCFHATVEDNGPGIANELHARLFEAFFTTKPDGMGMGLAISQSIAIDHEGRLWADENAAQGATFHLEIPMAKRAPSTRRDPAGLS